MGEGRRRGSRRWCASGSANSPVSMEGRDYLEDRFTAGDLMMTTVLRILRHTEMLGGDPALAAYRARCEARPAFARALAAQMAAVREECAGGRLGLDEPSVEPDAARASRPMRKREILRPSASRSGARRCA